MSDYQLIIRGAIVVSPEGEHLRDIGIRDGRIEALAPAVFGSTEADLDATGYHVFPGLVDAWVRLHGQERFRRDVWALAAGGVTTFLDTPPIRTRAQFEARRAWGEENSLVDFALWGAMTGDNLDAMEDLAECGVIGFHAWMSSAGTDRPMIDDGALIQGMCRARDLKAIVSIHAENGSITARLAREAAAMGLTSMRDYLDSRPVIAELEAIQRAILFAWDAECAVHFPQVSTGRGIELIAEAKAQGLNVSCSTSPHYLLLTESDAERLGALAKCAPPLRPPADLAALWERLAAGDVDFLVSAHAAEPMTNAGDIFAAPAGIAGGQSTLPLMLSEALGEDRPFPLSKLTELLSTNPARRFRLNPRKGELAAGADADLVLVDLHEEAPLQKETLFYEPAERSPYLGRPLRGRILRTLLRGRTVFREGQIMGKSEGRFVEAQSAGLSDEELIADLAEGEDVTDDEADGEADIVQRADFAEAQHHEAHQRG